MGAEPLQHRNLSVGTDLPLQVVLTSLTWWKHLPEASKVEVVWILQQQLLVQVHQQKGLQQVVEEDPLGALEMELGTGCLQLESESRGRRLKVSMMQRLMHKLLWLLHRLRLLQQTWVDPLSLLRHPLQLGHWAWALRRCPWVLGTRFHLDCLSGLLQQSQASGGWQYFVLKYSCHWQAGLICQGTSKGCYRACGWLTSWAYYPM